jgi:hypothetical protein
MTKLSLRIPYVRSGHHLHLGHMKQRTPQQQKKARLERRIAEVRRQLAQLRENLESCWRKKPSRQQHTIPTTLRAPSPARNLRMNFLLAVLMTLYCFVVLLA